MRKMLFAVLAVFLVVVAVPGVAQAAYCAGDENANSIICSTGNDLIEGFGGNDLLQGIQGNDSIYGDNGNDWLWGGQAADYLEGNGGDDRIYAGCRDVVCDAGSDNDLIGGYGNDILGADNGKPGDHLDGGPGTGDECHKDATDTNTGCEAVWIDGVRVK